MSRYAKDPSFFRAVYVDHMDAGKYDGPTPNKSVKTRGRYAMEFDDMIQKVKADAWEEALDSVDANKIELVDGRYLLGEWPHNPYRKQEEV